MKVKILAAVLLLFIFGAVAANTVLLPRSIDRIIENVSSLDTEAQCAGERTQEAYQSFRKAAVYFSLTLNHNDLWAVEDLFIEMQAYLAQEDAKEASVIKSRLIDALLHLRRLSGINIDSIF